MKSAEIEDLLKQRLAERDDRINELVYESAVAHAEAERLATRANHGVCPCCKRTFSQLARHMKTKHPDFKPLRAVS